MFSSARLSKDNANDGPDENPRSNSNWTFNPFDVDDLSPLDTLLRRGVIPLTVRLTQSQRYEDAVRNYMRKEGCDRPTAQRNMDAFFNDPNGWVVAKGRERDLGEDFCDINAPTGVQKRPVFSALWAGFCFYFFFVFLPARVEELGGISPSLGSNGYCLETVKVVDESGATKFVCPKSDFDKYVAGEAQRK